MLEDKLLEVYNSVVRSAVEYCSVVYDSLIPVSLSNKLESLQRRALRIIYGWNIDIDDIMNIKCIEDLSTRRKSAVLNFALKNELKERFGKRWFTETKPSDRPRRNGLTEKYIVPFCKTERSKANPIHAMTLALNKHYSQ